MRKNLQQVTVNCLRAELEPNSVPRVIYGVAGL